MDPRLAEMHPVPVKSELGIVDNLAEDMAKTLLPSKRFILADLDVDPPETDADTMSAPELTRSDSNHSIHDRGTSMSKEADVVEGEGQKLNKLGKCCSRIRKIDSSFDFGVDTDGDQAGQGSSFSHEEKVSSLKTGLVPVARKMPKNAHAHFLLGRMYQRLGLPQKAVLAYEKAEEILLRCEAEIARPELLSLVQIHHAQWRF